MCLKKIVGSLKPTKSNQTAFDILSDLAVQPEKPPNSSYCHVSGLTLSLSDWDQIDRQKWACILYYIFSFHVESTFIAQFKNIPPKYYGFSFHFLNWSRLSKLTKFWNPSKFKCKIPIRSLTCSIFCPKLNYCRWICLTFFQHAQCFILFYI